MLEKESLKFVQALTGNGYDDIDSALKTIDEAGLCSRGESAGQKLAEIYENYVEETGSTQCDLCGLVLEAVQFAARNDMEDFLDEEPEYENAPNYMATEFGVSEYTRRCFEITLREKRAENPDYNPLEDENYGPAFRYIIGSAENLSVDIPDQPKP